ANAHALATTQATAQEPLLVQGPRRTDEVGIAVGPGQPADAPHGGQEQTGPGHDHAAPGEVRQPGLTGSRGFGGKGDPAGRAAVQAIKAQHALAADESSRGPAGPFAVLLTDMAIAAGVRGLADAPGGETAQ